MACSGYPECRNTKKIVKSSDDFTVKQDIPLEEECPVCRKKLAIKHGRFGEYTACSDYPDCKYIKLKSTAFDGRSGCSGEIVERRSRQAKLLWLPIILIAILCSGTSLCWPCPMCNAPSR
jgi:DNA topoisomerase-1